MLIAKIYSKYSPIMNQIRNFKDFGIIPEVKGMEGDKIDMFQILNKEIEVHKFRIVKSKFSEKGNGMRLELQIVVDNRKRVVFSGSTVLQSQISKVPESEFPFKTTIVKDGMMSQFT